MSLKPVDDIPIPKGSILLHDEPKPQQLIKWVEWLSITILFLILFVWYMMSYSPICNFNQMDGRKIPWR